MGGHFVDLLLILRIHLIDGVTGEEFLLLDVNLKHSYLIRLVAVDVGVNDHRAESTRVTEKKYTNRTNNS